MFAAIACVVAPYLFPVRPHLAFYEAAAQVIPVLLLALALELRFFRMRAIPPDARAETPPVSRLDAALFWPTRMFPIVALFLMVLGEVVSLHAIASGHADVVIGRLVPTALLFGLVAVASAAVLASVQERDP